MFDPYSAKVGDKLDTWQARSKEQVEDIEDIVNKLERRGLTLLPGVEDKKIVFFVIQI